VVTTLGSYDKPFSLTKTRQVKALEQMFGGFFIYARNRPEDRPAGLPVDEVFNSNHIRLEIYNPEWVKFQIKNNESYMFIHKQVATARSAARITAFCR